MSGRDPAELADILLAWLHAKLPGAEIALPLPTRPAAGASSETYFLAPVVTERGVTQVRRMVLRVQATDPQVYEDPSVEREFRVMAALRRDGTVPVPEPLWLETDRAVLGEPFMVMAHVAGRIPGGQHHSGGYLTEIGPAKRERVWTSAIETMARLHAVDPAGLDFLGAPQNGLEAELARWQSYLHWSRIPIRPEQERGLRWLSDNRPGYDLTGLAWGDARPENMIFAGERCIAVIDWETVSLGGAECDLGWWLFFDWLAGEGYGIPRLDGVPGRAETLALWEAFAGRRLRDMHWHEAFATWRFGMIADRSLMLAWEKGAAGVPPPGAPRVYIDRLVRLISD